jgi:hypothetical protein
MALFFGIPRLTSPADTAESPTDYGCGFEGANQRGPEWATDQNRSDTWNQKNTSPKEHPPDATPKSSNAAPGLHAIARGIVANHILLGVVLLSGNGNFRRCLFGIGVAIVNGNHTVRVGGQVTHASKL